MMRWPGVTGRVVLEMTLAQGCSGACQHARRREMAIRAYGFSSELEGTLAPSRSIADSASFLRLARLV